MNKAFIDTSAILRMLVQDDELKAKAVENLIRTAPEQGIMLHVIPVTILEIVWVLEKVYKYKYPKRPYASWPRRSSIPLNSRLS